MASPTHSDIEANIPRDEDLSLEKKDSSTVVTLYNASSSSKPSTTSGGSVKEENEEVVLAAPPELPPKRGTTLTRYIFTTRYSSTSTQNICANYETALVYPPHHFSCGLTRPLKNPTTNASLADTFFSAYRRIFAVIFICNLTAFICFTAMNKGSPSLPNVKNATSANIMVCILFRQENVVNFVYEIFVRVPHSLPLSLRANAAKVFHYGGMHSGCGVAAVVWFIMYTALTTREFVRTPTHEAKSSVIVCYLLITMFLFILGGAHPKFRVRYHDYFEALHRFAGWSALVILWSHTFIVGSNNATINHESIAKAIGSQPSFWFLIISSMCGIISWFRLRKREVFPEILSDHAIRLHFKYKPMNPFYGIKLSDSPLFEWHAFATIPDHDETGKKTGFSVVVSNAGDWTKRHINNPPKKLWIRGYPLHGLLYTSKLFKKVVLVATGSGIGPCLSLMYSNEVNCRILWSTPNPETVFGQKIIDEVKRSDPKAVIWNTRTRGRPADIVGMAYQLLKESDCEAVFVISNPKVTRKIVYGMENRGIPAYGAIFDS